MPSNAACGVAKRSIGRVVGRVWLLLSVLVFLQAASAQAEELIFADDFQRLDGPVIGMGWTASRHAEPCAPAGESLPVQPRPNIFPEPGVGLRAGQLFFSETHSGQPQRAYRDFRRRIKRLEYDFVPMYTMGGLDDRSRLGIRIQFLDVEGTVLGELGDFFHTAEFGAFTNSDRVYWRTQPGLYDHHTRHGVIRVQDDLDLHLTGVDQGRIDRTRVIFESFAAWCGSALETAVDNVQVYAESSALFSLTRPEMAEFASSCRAFHNSGNPSFPQTWYAHVATRFGAERLAAWLPAIRAHVGADPVKLVRLVEELTGATGPQAWDAGYALALLLWKE